jgi:amino-acid N-acetyltransferase
MKERFETKPATVAHLAAAVGLLRDCDLPVEGVREHFETGYAVALSGEEVIGVCGVEVHGSYGLLRSTAVSTAWRGRSVGRALVEDRVSWARGRGLSALYLLTTDAAGYFKRLGFVRVARDDAPPEIKLSEEFSSLCPLTSVVMFMSLG